MQLKDKKCVAMDISRARQPWTPQYTIGGVALDYVCTQRLLGVHISRDLHWNHHVDVQRKKAARTLGFAARNLRGCTQRVKSMAYLTLMKPKLFYGTDYNAMARITVGRVHRGDDPQHPRLQQPPARTELGQCVFDYRVVAFWNAAPSALKDCSAAHSFLPSVMRM
ncbi:Hypothetical predicted protein [Cloeon dipterum]|uniref:Uncharacterized protein n=1 Tax=Cloeon dipterum TaxID=197152 RepID=A0A8S1E404_9INSE|nr:Hypothetical predicted protein [Cloeon dipterum]